MLLLRDLSCVIIGCFFLSFASVSCSSASAAKEEETIAKTVHTDEGVLFKRSNFVVADMDRSLSIYRDILGFSLFGSIEESSEESYSYPVFKIPKEAKIRFATLNSPSQERTLALTEITGIELPKPAAPLMSAVVIRVDDIQARIAEIEGLDLETTKLKVVESERINFKEQAFIDFDGHLIVLYETF